MKTILHKCFKTCAALALFLILWEIAPRTGIVNAAYIPPFSGVLGKACALIANGEMGIHLSASLYRAFMGFGLSLLVGFPLGLLLAWNKGIREYIFPLVTVFGQISPLALLPLFIIVFGLGETSKIGIIFWGCVWRILLGTMSGVSHVDLSLVRAAKTMGANQPQILFKVVIPAALPEIYPAVQGAVTGALLMLVAAELLGASRGLGYLITYSQQIFDIPEMFAAILMIAILGLVFSNLLEKLGEKLLYWNKAL